MNENVQEIVTDRMQRQSLRAEFLPTYPTECVAGLNGGTAVLAIVRGVVDHVESGETKAVQQQSLQELPSLENWALGALGGVADRLSCPKSTSPIHTQELCIVRRGFKRFKAMKSVP